MSAAATVTERAEPLHWSPMRVATGLVVATWASLFWFLMLTGRTSLYLSTRTSWLVPLGVAILTTAAVGRLWSARVAHPEPLARRETWLMGAIALPAIVLMALPPITLGSYATNKRSSFGGTGLQASAREVSGPLDFIDIGAAQSFDPALAQLEKRGGEEIMLDGFVSKEPGMLPDELTLTRYIVTCCAADATVARVTVVGVPPGRYHPDDWLHVVGRVYPIGRDILVAAETISTEPVPSQPYLTP
ncbi:MAG: TIGR03943 family putative permease subunit [Actinomycetota bacterium]